MRAVAVHEIGDEPELMELPMPRPAAGEIVVELAAASVNPIDVGIADGRFPMPRISPLVLGVDGAGRVTEVGLSRKRPHLLGRTEGCDVMPPDSMLVRPARLGHWIGSIHLVASRGEHAESPSVI